MANVTIVKSRSRPQLRFRVHSIHEYLVMFLFVWYVLYPGLGVSGLIPFYDLLDDLTFVVMFGLSLPKLAARKGKVRLHPLLFWTILAVWAVVGISKLYHQSSLSLTVKYTYLISRPLILLLYIASYNLPVKRVFDKIVKISRVLILYNLPAIVFNLVTVNVKVLEATYNDSIAGFFPFGNNDSLVWLYSIVLFKDFYQVFIQRQRNRWWLFALEYLLLLSTMSLKYIVMVTLSFGIIIFLRSRNKLRNALILSIVVVGPAILLLPIIRGRFPGIQHAPVYRTASIILRGEVSEHDMLTGTGPGTFTSPTAFDAESRLAHRYGLFEMKHYWEEVYKGPTGTLTRSTSSALTLLGDTGILTVGLYGVFLLFIIKRDYRHMRTSYICLTGFSMGIYALAAGLFLNSWFWGLEVFLVMLSAKYVSDQSNTRRQAKVDNTVPT